MFCPECGAEVVDGAAFCGKCGASLAEWQADVDKQAEEVKQSASRPQQESRIPPSPSMTQPISTPQPAQGQKTPLKANRSLGAFIGLSIITFGIYLVVWMYQYIKDINILCEGDGQKPTPQIGVYIGLSLLTLGGYGMYWFYVAGNRLYHIKDRYGVDFDETGTTILAFTAVSYASFGIASLFLFWLLIKDINALCESYNRMYCY